MVDEKEKDRELAKKQIEMLNVQQAAMKDAEAAIKRQQVKQTCLMELQILATLAQAANNAAAAALTVGAEVQRVSEMVRQLELAESFKGGPQ